MATDSLWLMLDIMAKLATLRRLNYGTLFVGHALVSLKHSTCEKRSISFANTRHTTQYWWTICSHTTLAPPQVAGPGP